MRARRAVFKNRFLRRGNEKLSQNRGSRLSARSASLYHADQHPPASDTPVLQEAVQEQDTKQEKAEIQEQNIIHTQYETQIEATLHPADTAQIKDTPQTADTTQIEAVQHTSDTAQIENTVQIEDTTKITDTAPVRNPVLVQTTDEAVKEVTNMGKKKEKEKDRKKKELLKKLEAALEASEKSAVEPYETEPQGPSGTDTVDDDRPKASKNTPKIRPALEVPDVRNTVILSEKKARKLDTECFENRELSWLKFNERVLEEAEDSENPLGERLNFLSIYQTNLDEFFMVRVGSLHDQMILNNSARENKTFMTPGEQIAAISKRVRQLAVRNSEAFRDVMAGLRNYGIRLTNFASLEKSEAAYLEAYFKTEVLPLLSPVVVTKKQPFPFLENEDLYAFCMLEKKGERERVGMVACSIRSLNRLIPIRTHKGEYMLAEELILHFLPLVFRSYTVGEKAIVRITRNADIDADNIYDEDLDYRELMQKLIRSRKRLSPVRLEYTRSMNKKTIGKLCQELELPVQQAFLTERPLDLSFLSTFRNNLYSTNPELFYERRQPQKSAELSENRPMIDQVLEKDVLLYYPYERMNPTISLLQEAARDPDVVSIRMTLYRLAKNSQIVSALVTASEAGKQVDVLVELKARFDEENNIHWSHMLEDAGCHVMYGLGPYKVHSKLLLITRVRDGKTEFITQIGTGNYNENTARLYTDLCFMTAKEKIGLDAVRIFQALSLEELPTDATELLVSPLGLQNRILSMIDHEIEEKKAGRPAYIGLKLNSITDKDIIDKLIEASGAGVKIEMIVRGINCLHSAIPGKTDNIRLISIVGRFLEHARIYIFGTPEREKIFISSADFMTRNTLRRVEVAVPVEEPELRAKIHRIFDLQLQDNVKAREQSPDGIYRKRVPEPGEAPVNSQEISYEKAYSPEGL